MTHLSVIIDGMDQQKCMTPMTHSSVIVDCEAALAEEAEEAEAVEVDEAEAEAMMAMQHAQCTMYLQQAKSRMQLSEKNGPHTKFEQFIDYGPHTQFMRKFDGHMWLTNEDGQIIDPTINVEPAYWKIVAEMHDCIWPPQFVHLPVRDQILRSRLWDFIRAELIKPKIRDARILGVGKKQLWKMFFEQPQHNNCHINCWAYYKHVDQKLLVKIGSLGLQRGDGTIWWEFG